MKKWGWLILILAINGPALGTEPFEKALRAMDQANASQDANHPGYTEAYKVFSALVEKGNPGTDYHLGILHLYGLGGARFDQYEAVQLIKKGAQGGYLQAQSLLGLMIEKSDGTLVSTDPAKALAWYEKAAAGRHCVAIRRLHKAYQNGELGLEKNKETALSLKTQELNCKKR